MSARTQKILAIILLIVFAPALIAITLAVLIHPLFLLFLLMIIFAVPLLRAIRD